MDRDVDGRENDGAEPVMIAVPGMVETTEGTTPTEARVPGGHDAGGGHGAMGHGGMGHLLHMAPMALILFAPRLGLLWTLVLVAAFVGLMVWRSMRSRAMKAGSHLPDADGDGRR